MSDYYSHNAGSADTSRDVVEYEFIGVTEHVVMWTDEKGDAQHTNTFTVGSF